MSEFYCSQKFWWLSVDINRGQSYSCCTATPHKIDTKWLSQNPGQLFNTPTLHQERTMMLNNQPVNSCESACWSVERQGVPSRRQYHNSDKKTHLTINASPKTVSVVFGNDCNMTCAYCCKQYSSSWFQDIKNNGPYNINLDNNRYSINNNDVLQHRISQKEILNAETVNLLIKEIVELSKEPTLHNIQISGGEPFLNNNLLSLLLQIDPLKEVVIFTGLGVHESRFEKIISALALHKNIKLCVSNENIGARYEFNRYGNTWERFCNNIDIIKKYNIKYRFSATLSNLTLFGLKEFFAYTGHTPVTFNLCNDPDFLSVSVLDPESKHQIKQDIVYYPQEIQQTIIDALEVDPTHNQKTNVAMYIKEFAQRRQLKLNVFPMSFINWIEGN